MVVKVVEDGEVAKGHRRPLPAHCFNCVHDELGLLLASVVHNGLHCRRVRQLRFFLQAETFERLALPLACLQLNDGVAGYCLISTAQYRWSGATILRHADALHTARTKRREELLEDTAGGAAEAIDRLVRIADGEDVSFCPGQQTRHSKLRNIGILELVNQDKARSFLRPLQ